jgi:hypothetical protein
VHEQEFQAREQEYQAIAQEVQALELTVRSQVLPQDVSIAHDILDQDVHVFHAHATRSSTRAMRYYFASPIEKTLVAPHMCEFSDEAHVHRSDVKMNIVHFI